MENEVILFNCVGRITGKWLEMYYACGISCFSKNTILIHVLYNINTIYGSSIYRLERTRRVFELTLDQSLNVTFELIRHVNLKVVFVTCHVAPRVM